LRFEVNGKTSNFKPQTSNNLPNSYFQFKKFIIHQDKCAMKVTTDACLFGAWVAEEINNEKLIINNLLDIGAGTGLLSLMFAQKKTETKIDAIEIDKDAAEQAEENAEASQWKDRIQIINADVTAFPFNKKYDLIISNSPFYENELRSASERKNTAHHSENLTLEKLLTAIKKNLSTDGNFFLLLPYKRNEEIRKLFKHHQLFISKIMLTRQSVIHDYFRVFIKGKLKNQEKDEVQFDEMSIWDDKQQYTTEFVRLLKDYYLYLWT
jgi:Predicted O-methyltransferase